MGYSIVKTYTKLHVYISFSREVSFFVVVNPLEMCTHVLCKFYEIGHKTKDFKINCFKTEFSPKELILPHALSDCPLQLIVPCFFTKTFFKMSMFQISYTNKKTYKMYRIFHRMTDHYFSFSIFHIINISGSNLQPV